jgi:hypothetical protein
LAPLKPFDLFAEIQATIRNIKIAYRIDSIGLKEITSLLLGTLYRTFAELILVSTEVRLMMLHGILLG